MCRQNSALPSKEFEPSLNQEQIAQKSVNKIKQFNRNDSEGNDSTEKICKSNQHSISESSKSCHGASFIKYTLHQITNITECKEEEKL